MATALDDLIIVQRGNQGGAEGNDTFILTNNLVEANENIVISDTQGSNKVQLITGLSIASALVSNDAVRLSLSNGATITVLGADTFSFEIAGMTGTTGTIQDFDTFATDTLNTTVPAAGEAANSNGAIAAFNQAPSYPEVEVVGADPVVEAPLIA